VIESTLCCITRDTKSGHCNGDSGGPLTVERDGKVILVGVVSFGALAGCELGFPTGYARVTYFMPWIVEHLLVHG
jgi:chymotrypsin